MTIVRNHLLCLTLLLVFAGLVNAQGYDALGQYQQRQAIAAQKLKAELNTNFSDAEMLKKSEPDKARELLRKNRVLLEDDTTLSTQERNNYLERINLEIAQINDRAAAAKLAEKIAVIQGAQVAAFENKLRANDAKALAANNPSSSAVIAAAQAGFKAKIQAQVIAQQQYLLAMQKAAQQQVQQPGVWTGPSKTDKSAPPARDIAIMKALNSTMKVNFNGQPMKEVLDLLEDKTRGILTFIVDEDVLKEAMIDPKEFYNDPVTKSYRQPLKVRTFLKMILSERKMGYYLEDGNIIITRADKAINKMTIKTYPVSNLVGGPQLIQAAINELQFSRGQLGPNGQLLSQNIDGLTAQIMGAVEPDYWRVNTKDLSGPGTMQFVPGTGSLAIRASLEVHYLLLASGQLDNTPKR